jgi:hypothetical protein
MSNTAESLAAVFSCELPVRPYPGLRPFEPREWPVFFGREIMADEVIRRVVRDRFLVVHGDSGCGKSSLIYAGVMPHLEQEAARSGVRWRTCAAHPGEHPLENLARALAGLDGRDEDRQRVTELRRVLNFGRDGAVALIDMLGAGPATRVCLLVDQFEELFAHAKQHGPHEANLLIELLIGIQQHPNPGICAVLTMRSEFLGACAKFPGFAEAVNATQYLVPRMEHPDLVRAIREPATLFNGEIERELAENLIADAGGAQDQLPLIQHGLMLLYRDYVVRAGVEPGARWKLTLQVCKRGGRGLGELLSDHANEVSKSVAHERVVEDLFRALTDINADGHAVRRPQTFSQLVAVTGGNKPVLRTVIDAFRAEGISFLRPYGARPLTPEDRIDISHEALIRCWNQIAEREDGWLIREFKNGLVWRSLLVQTDSFDKDPKNVLSSATTEERVTWMKRRNAAWSERYGGGWNRVQRLIAASIVEQDRLKQEEILDRQREEESRIREVKLQEKARAVRLFRVGLVVTVVLLLLVSLLAVYATREQGRANTALRQAETESALNAAARARAEERRAELEQVVSNLTESVNELQKASEATVADAKLRAEIQQAQGRIAEQVARISTVANPPRIYLHISEESQREAARELALRIERQRIGKESIVVPGVELKVSKTSALRCFRAGECAEEGKLLASIVNDLLQSPKVDVQDLTRSIGPGNARPRHYEIWFAPGPIALVDAGYGREMEQKGPTGK